MKSTTNHNGLDELEFYTLSESPFPGIRLKHVINYKNHRIIRHFGCSTSNELIAVATDDNVLRIWDVKNGIRLKVIKWIKAPVNSISWSPNNKFLAVSTIIGAILILDTSDFSLLFELIDPLRVNDKKGQEYDIIKWSPDCQFLYTGSYHDSILKFWDLSTKQITSRSECSYGIQNFEIIAKINTILAITKNGYFKSINLDSGLPKDIPLLENLSSYISIKNPVCSIRFAQRLNLLFLGFTTGEIKVFDLISEKWIFTLEGHTDAIQNISISSNNNFLFSKSIDQSIRIWKIPEYKEVNKFLEFNALGGLDAIQSSNILISLGNYNEYLRIWELDYSLLSKRLKKAKSVIYTSAKIVLVGESNIGKSCLAMRLAEDRYPKDHEHKSTHGMRFWQMKAEQLHPSAKPHSGFQREVILWDMGGQPEYQLIHQLFLNDTTVALILIDPTRGQTAINEARAWNKQIEKHIGCSQAIKILVGAKMDEPSDLVCRDAIQELCKEFKIVDYIELSALNGYNIDILRATIAKAIDWSRLAKTSRPQLFQKIREEIEIKQNEKEVQILYTEFREIIKRKFSKQFSEKSLKAVVNQLSKQGLIAQTNLYNGNGVIILQVPIIEQYACSLILAARNHPRRIPVIEERQLGAPNIGLPGIEPSERLIRYQELIVLECIIEMMIQNGICFRHDNLIIFPSLFPKPQGYDLDVIPHSISLYYDFTGSIDNIYASLVAGLMISDEFGDGRLWPARAEFTKPNEGLCGLRQYVRPGGLAHIDIYFSEGTNALRRNIFTLFVENNLKEFGIEIKEHQSITCSCGFTITEDIVHFNIEKGHNDVICSYCRATILISDGVDQIKASDPESDKKIIALKKDVERKSIQDVNTIKMSISQTNDALPDPTVPIRLRLRGSISTLTFESRRALRSPLKAF